MTRITSTHRVASQRIVDIIEVMDIEFVEDGYIRVYQDIRGLHRSEGAWVLNRPLAGPVNDTSIDESTDAWDTIDWLVKNVPESNGKVGVIGSSYLGFTTLMAQINPHPALKATVPQSPMVDGWMGDDWFHNGAFRISSFEYVVGQSTKKAEGGGDFALGGGDDYTRYLEAGSMADFTKMLGIQHYPGVRKFLDNPAYTEFWSLQAVDKWLAAEPLKVPTLLEVGQWDQEDSYGAPAVYRAMEPKDKNNDMVFLHIGPWRHSGANHYGFDLGALIFTGDTAREWRVKYVKPFFDHYLKGGPDPKTPPVLTYATGANQWNSSPRWPMGAATPIYLAAGGVASFERPKASGREDYISDPAKPVPFIPRPIDMGDSDAVEAVADSRPALRVGAPRCSELEISAARQGGAHHGRADGRVVCFDHRHGQRLGCEADRRLSQRRAGTRRAGREALDGRVRAADRYRDLSRPLCEELRRNQRR